MAPGPPARQPEVSPAHRLLLARGLRQTALPREADTGNPSEGSLLCSRAYLMTPPTKGASTGGWPGVQGGQKGWVVPSVRRKKLQAQHGVTPAGTSHQPGLNAQPNCTPASPRNVAGQDPQ